jgi:hypothetical protein
VRVGNKFQPGDLVEFFYIYNGCELNNRVAVYLGETGEYSNHRVQLLGEKKISLIDKGLLPFLKMVSERIDSAS